MAPVQLRTSQEGEALWWRFSMGPASEPAGRLLQDFVCLVRRRGGVILYLCGPAASRGTGG
jgi:hypothetical protein